MPPAFPLSILVCVGRDKNGRPCKYAPVLGDNRCVLHYGSSTGRTARHTFKRAKWYTEVKVGVKPSMRMGAPRDIDPGVALLEEIHRSAGHVAWLEDKVRGLEESELVWGRV